MLEEVVEHRHSAAELVCEVDRLVGHFLQEALHVAAGPELDVLQLSRVVERPALAVVELSRDDELVDVLLRLVHEVRFLAREVLCRLGVVLEEELRGVVLKLRLLDVRLGELRDVLAEVVAAALGHVDVEHELLAGVGEHHKPLLRRPLILDDLLERRKRVFAATLRRLRLLDDHLVRALDEAPGRVDDLVDGELALKYLLDARGVVRARVVADVLSRLADHHRQHLFKEELERGAGRAQSEVFLDDSFLVQDELERGAYLLHVFCGYACAEVVGVGRDLTRDVLARLLRVDAVHRGRDEVVELGDVGAEAGLAHLHALRRVGVVCVRLVRLEVDLLVRVDAVHQGLQVLVDEVILAAGEAAAVHRARVEVLHYSDAARAVVELGVEPLEYLLDFAAAERLPCVYVAVLVLRAQYQVLDVVPCLAEEFQVALDGREELLAHGPVVRRARVGAPGKRHVYLVVELLYLQVAVRALGEAHVALVGTGLVVDHLAVVVDCVRILVGVQLRRCDFR